ncbi:unnamed protein product [Gongylonema pulchrum]|uniref:FATC domain-containing protein n=1 Tax=Gongylonema pulchrum TaxID=637853 RepID=A0A183ECQ3_9BILA|nr:unnamed protein product [Gongylonema pulchrum]
MHDIRPLLKFFAHVSPTDEIVLILLSGVASRGGQFVSDLGSKKIKRIGAVICNVSEGEITGQDGTPVIQVVPKPCAERYEGQQQQNLHGKHVVKRVLMKLDGVVSNDSGKNQKDVHGKTETLTVAEQVDLLIRQAMDISNLSLMYEGWTAWV